MIEGFSIESRLGTGLETQDLRRLDWAELVARFAAANELRTSLHGRAGIGAGSFVRFASRTSETVNASAPRVNHADLGHGKADAANTANEALPDKGGVATRIREL